MPRSNPNHTLPLLALTDLDLGSLASCLVPTIRGEDLPDLGPDRDYEHPRSWYDERQDTALRGWCAAMGPIAPLDELRQQGTAQLDWQLKYVGPDHHTSTIARICRLGRAARAIIENSNA